MNILDTKEEATKYLNNYFNNTLLDDKQSCYNQLPNINIINYYYDTLTINSIISIENDITLYKKNIRFYVNLIIKNTSKNNNLYNINNLLNFNYLQIRINYNNLLHISRKICEIYIKDDFINKEQLIIYKSLNYKLLDNIRN
tara:strand:- start:69 stop:494 length:426 start_codon:yes stop_codon:yes gene_type:complete